MNQIAAISVGRVVAAVFFVWSGLVLATVYGGLGARYSLHPDSPVAGVASVDLSSATSGVNGMEHYSVVSERPLFNESRRPVPTEGDATDATPVTATDTQLNVVVTSIVLTPERNFVIVLDQNTNQSQTLKPGESLLGDQAAWKLAELGPRNAVFEGPGGRTTLELRVFDGTGGEAPTPVTVASPVVQESSSDGGARNGSNDAQAVIQEDKSESPADTPESRAEQIRRRIEERRRQMREEAERARAERGE